jgi:hypothetical protein
MKSFRELIEKQSSADQSLQDMKVDIYKMLKKKYKANFSHLTSDFKEEETIDYKWEGSKLKIYVNQADFSSPVYDFEWM